MYGYKQALKPYRLRTNVKTNDKSKIFTFSLAVLPFMIQYFFTEGFPVSVGTLLVCFSMLVPIIHSGRIYQFDKVEIACLLFYASLSLISVFGYLSYGIEGTTGLLRYLKRNFDFLVLVLLIYSGRRYLDRPFYIKLINIIALFASFVMLYQLFVDQSFQLYLPLYHLYSRGGAEFMGNFIIRPNSIFSEPSEYALNIIYVLVIDIFEIKQKKLKEWSMIIFLTVCGLLSMSATAIGCIAIIYFFLVLGKSQNKLKMIAFVMIVGGVAGLLFKDYILYSYNRIFFSGESRIFGFLNYFDTLDWSGKTFGVGIGNFQVIFHEQLELTSFLSGLGRVCMENGVVGVVALCIFFFRIFKICPSKNKIMAVLLIVINIFSPIVYSSYLSLYVIAAFYVARNKQVISSAKI